MFESFEQRLNRIERVLLIRNVFKNRIEALEYELGIRPKRRRNRRRKLTDEERKEKQWKRMSDAEKESYLDKQLYEYLNDHVGRDRIGLSNVE